MVCVCVVCMCDWGSVCVCVCDWDSVCVCVCVCERRRMLHEYIVYPPNIGAAMQPYKVLQKVCHWCWRAMNTHTHCSSTLCHLWPSLSHRGGWAQELKHMAISLPQRWLGTRAEALECPLLREPGNEPDLRELGRQAPDFALCIKNIYIHTVQIRCQV